MTSSQLIKSPCVNGKIHNDLDSIAFSKDFTFTGQSEYSTCVKDVQKLFQRPEPCKIENDLCSFKNFIAPNITNTSFYVGFSFKIVL